MSNSHNTQLSIFSGILIIASFILGSVITAVIVGVFVPLQIAREQAAMKPAVVENQQMMVAPVATTTKPATTTSKKPAPAVSASTTVAL